MSNRMKHVSVLLLFGVSVASATRIVADDAHTPEEMMPLSPEQGLCVQIPEERSPTTEEWSQSQIEFLAPYGSRKWFALIRSVSFQLERWGNGDEARKEADQPEGLSPEKVGKFEEDFFLAVLDSNGKILKRSSPFALGHGSLEEISRREWIRGAGMLLAADTVPECPHVLLAWRPPKMFCFDWQLAKTRELDPPMDFLSGAHAALNGDFWTLNLFGTPNQARKAPMARQPLGYRLTLPQGQPTPFPATYRQAFDAVKPSLRDVDGGPIRVDPATLTVVPVLGISATSQADLLLIAGEGKSVRSTEEPCGATVSFSLMTLKANDLSKPKRLPLWVVRDDRSDVLLDANRGLIHLPCGAKLANLQVFAGAANRLWLYLVFGFQVADTPKDAADSPGHRSRAWSVAQILAEIRDTHVELLLDLENQILQSDAVLQRLATSEYWIVPTRLMGPAGNRRLAFHALSFAKDKKKAKLPCAAIFSLPP